jgi:FtsP/CotA-like multicopper oxidase with cupredoxin domain
MVINGPSTMDYDEDLGTLPVTDFYYKSMYELSFVANGAVQPFTGPPVADNGLINGMNMNVAKTAGSYHNVTLTPGKKYKLRLINTSVDNHFRMSLDRHSFHVIQADFVPIVPYETDWVFLAIGQRYDVIFEATEDPGNYWFRAEVQSGCGTNKNALDIRAIFNYKGVKIDTPKSTPEANYTMNCLDEPDLEPLVKKDVPEDSFAFTSNDTLTVGVTQNDQKIFFWNING